MLKKTLVGINFLCAALFVASAPVSAIDYAIPALPQTGTNPVGFVFAGCFVLAGVVIARFSSLSKFFRKG
jgi:LPXTG-motif cell wall-anchored protein